MVFLDPESPHAFMKTSRVQIPHSKASCHVRPRGIVSGVIHAQIKQVSLPSGVWDKVFEVGARIFGMIQKLGFPKR